MNYTVYNPSTGQILTTFTSVDPDLVNLNLQGKTYIVGLFDSSKYYINNSQAIQIPTKPTNDYIVYNFDWSTKTWIIDVDQTSQNARNQRNQLLTNIDRVNPVWYASLTTEQQQELVVYRQQLLAVPEQAGFPSTIDWPAKPTWL